jgi:3-keto-5-aminohexanoate cleavage enzyme
VRRSPIIVEAAINGATPRSRNPHVPRTPVEIAACALGCLDRGAAIVHNHNDEPNVGGPARHDHVPYAEAWRPVLEAHPKALLHPTVRGMSHDAPIAERYSHLDSLWDAGLLPMASADPGVVAIGNFIYGNSADDAAYMFEWCRTRRLPVHVSVFEPGFLRAVLQHHAAGTLPELVKIQLYFGGHAPFGLPPTERSLDAYVAMLEGTGLPWMVGVITGDVVSSGLATAAIERGGHLRVGLEDYAGRNTPSNEALVIEAIDLIQTLGHDIATSEQTLQILADR